MLRIRIFGCVCCGVLYPYLLLCGFFTQKCRTAAGQGTEICFFYSAGSEKEKDALTADFINYDWKLEDAARRLQDREITTAAEEMKDLVVAIYRERKRFPEKNVVIQKFSSFYLPASVKLLHRYAELEQQTERTKEQEEFLLRLKSAFMDVRNGLKTLWDSMTEPEDLELSAEVTVMENKLAGDGLLRDFSVCSSAE